MQAIRELEDEGYSISLIGNDIMCQKKERANPDPVKVGHLLTAVKEKKGEAIEYLKKRFCYDRHLEDAIERLNHLGARCTATSSDGRKRAYDLEIQLTMAANGGDIEKFMKLVDEWESIFVRGNTVTIQ